MYRSCTVRLDCVGHSFSKFIINFCTHNIHLRITFKSLFAKYSEALQCLSSSRMGQRNHEGHGFRRTGGKASTPE